MKTDQIIKRLKELERTQSEKGVPPIVAARRAQETVTQEVRVWTGKSITDAAHDVFQAVRLRERQDQMQGPGKIWKKKR